MMAPSDKPTFARMFSARSVKRFASSKLVDSSANDDMVVKDPQKPTAANRLYCESKFKATDKTENKPKMKLPNTLTTNTFTGNP